MLDVRPLHPFQDVVLLTPKVFGDDRGFFLEGYNARAFKDATGLAPDFV